MANPHTCAYCKGVIDRAVQALETAACSQSREGPGFVCEWVRGGTRFHETCFAELLARRRSSGRNRGGSSSGDTGKNAPRLSRAEGALVSAALRVGTERAASLTEVRTAAARCAALIRGARRVVFFTGAGISTAAGIPDYRGTAGIDSMADISSTHDRNDNQDGDNEEEAEVNYHALRPTAAHRAVARIVAAHNGYVVSQNVDNLHSRSGVPRTRMSELHGNVYVEYCENCRHEYERDFCVDAYSTLCYAEPWFVKCGSCGLGHYTGRKCNRGRCRGRLRDTIVNFGDDLPHDILGGWDRAEKNCQEADVIIALGSSLSVTPASELVAMGRRLVVCNLQKTERDADADLRVWATADEFLTEVERLLDEH